MKQAAHQNMQQIASTGLVLILAVVVCWVSYAGEPADAFLFPRLISIGFVILAGWAFVRAFASRVVSGGGLELSSVTNLAPGLLLLLIYVFWAAKTLGFYTASTLTVFCILSLYDPAPHDEVASWIRRAVITTIFMAVIYCLFTLVLKVQTPRGILF